MAAVLYEIDNDGKDDYEFNETVFEDAVSEDDKPISIQDNKGRSWENRRLYPGGKDDIIVKISRTAK